MNIANNARRLLINLGKALPFIVCFLVFLSYMEGTCAVLTENYIYFRDYVLPNKPISFAIGEYFEYDIMSVLVMFIISVAVETCVWNKLAVLYLALHLVLKSYLDFELEPYAIYAISISQILISGFFVYKGVRILLSN